MGVTEIQIKGDTDQFRRFICKELGSSGEHVYKFSEIGQQVFLTQEQAINKLVDIAKYLRDCESTD